MRQVHSAKVSFATIDVVVLALDRYGEYPFATSRDDPARHRIAESSEEENFETAAARDGRRAVSSPVRLQTHRTRCIQTQAWPKRADEG
jgi:hypothetical protein